MQATQLLNSSVTTCAGFTFFKEERALYRLNVDEDGEHVSTTHIVYDDGRVAGEFTVTPDGRRTTSLIFDLGTLMPVSRIDYEPNGYTALRVTLFHRNADNQTFETVITGGGEILHRS